MFNPVFSFVGHYQEICGLKLSPDGSMIASGGNDNKLFVYSPKTLYPLMKKNHKAAVKAIAWSEKHYGLLATGAGNPGIAFSSATNIPNIVNIVFNVFNTLNIALILFSCWFIMLIALFLATLA